MGPGGRFAPVAAACARLSRFGEALCPSGIAACGACIARPISLVYAITPSTSFDSAASEPTAVCGGDGVFLLTPGLLYFAWIPLSSSTLICTEHGSARLNRFKQTPSSCNSHSVSCLPLISFYHIPTPDCWLHSHPALRPSAIKNGRP